MGWELGSGLGHVRPLLAVAKELAARGHRPVFAVKSLLEAAPVLREQRFAVLQAPVFPPRENPGGRPFRAASFADILAIRGFADADELAVIVDGWQRLIELVQPDLIVCDHSPTLCLAAYQAIPVVMLGTGFTVPPSDGAVFPPLLTDVPPLCPQEHVLDVVREVQRRRQRPSPSTLPGLFAPAARFVCTFAELDPYRLVRSEPPVGPLNPLPAAREPPTRPAFFAYLPADYPSVDKILALLARMKLPGSVYVRGAPKQLVEGLRQTGLNVYTAPAPLHDVMPNVSAILHQGGLLTTEDALAAGRPQVLLPRYLEQELTARAVQSMGLATYIAGRFKIQAVAQALHQIIADPRFSRHAMAWAKTIHERGPYQPLPRIVERCLSLLG
jgi:UDP:flavonoid glycosyltransferase YjiC (YdhE family)